MKVCPCFGMVSMQAGTLPLSLIKKFVLLLSPFAPHIGEELWRILGEQNTVAYAEWSSYDPALIIDESVTMPVQVNGKVRALLQVEKDASVAEVEELAKQDENVIKAIGSMSIVKVVVVPGRIVSLHAK